VFVMAPRTTQPVMSNANLNFMYGCRRVSPGCDHCYIERYWNDRYFFKGKMIEEGVNTPFDGKPIFFNEKERLKMVDSLPHNSIVFVNGLSDTFGEFITDEQRDRWVRYLAERPQYQFQLCTKRTGRMELYFRTRKVPPNVWVGTTIEDKERLFRLDLLREIDARIRWISFEPLLEDLGDVDLDGIQYAACGGETDLQRNYREFRIEWAENLYENCQRDGVAFWYIGANGLNDSRRGDASRGTIAQQWPDFERCRCSECRLTENPQLESYFDIDGRTPTEGSS
jgi:protein gp37